MGDATLSASPAGGLYPDITKAGGLGAAFTEIFSTIYPPLPAATIHAAIAVARIEYNDSLCLLSMSQYERSFSSIFWRDGIGHGELSAADLSDIARAVHVWLNERPTLARMQQHFPLFMPSRRGKAHEAGRTTEYQWAYLPAWWRKLLHTRPSDDLARSLSILIETAMQVPQLRQLYPYTSHYQLHFSRVTGYPFTDDCPHALPLGNGRYRACSAEYRIVKRTLAPSGYGYDEKVHEILGEGTADEVIAMIVANIPPGYGPAVNGTADHIDS